MRADRAFSANGKSTEDEKERRHLTSLKVSVCTVLVLILLPVLPNSALGQVGTVQSHQKISDLAGNFTGHLDDGDSFGHSVASLGDIDGDGVKDLAVGVPNDDDGRGKDLGAVWVLFLNTDGIVKSHQKISVFEGGFDGAITSNDRFGQSVASVGDLDGDAIGDLAVGATGDGDEGAVWVLFLNVDGTVKSHQRISDREGGFTGVTDAGDLFGESVASLGDLDGDGVTDLAVGARGDDDGGDTRGAVWVLFLNTDGTVKSHQKISATEGGFTGTLDDLDLFGSSVASLGDLDGDGTGDLAVGAIRDEDGGPFTGAVWVLFLNTDGTVKSHQKISDTQGGFTGAIDDDLFGHSLTSLGDLDGDGVTDLAVGASDDDDGGLTHGAVWVLFLNTDGTVKSHQKISDTQGGFTGELDNDRFGNSATSLGDLNGDGVVDLAVGASWDDDGGTPLSNHGAVWVLFLNGPIVTAVPVIPSLQLTLDQNHPNPFYPTTRIPYALDREEQVFLAIYDVSGKLVTTLVNRRMAPGAYLEEWDGRDNRGKAVASGVYFYRIKAGTSFLTRKAVIIR